LFYGTGNIATYLSGGGGSGGNISAGATFAKGAAGLGFQQNNGGVSGASVLTITANGTATGGSGTAGVGYGSGGGGGGAASVTNATITSAVATSGAGGNGAAGAVYIWY